MNKNKRTFDIPIATIVVLCFLIPPAGIALAAFRLVGWLIDSGVFSSAKSIDLSSFQDKENKRMYASSYHKDGEMDASDPAAKYSRPGGYKRESVGSEKTSTSAGQSKPDVNANYQYYYASAPKTEPSAATKKAEKTKKKSGDKGSLALKIFGGILLALCALILLSGIPDLFTPTWLDSVLPAASITGVASAACLFGASVREKAKARYGRIRAIIGEKESVNLSKLAAASGRTIRQIRRDVQKMINKGEFGDQAYIDLATDNFMRTPDAVPDKEVVFDYKKLYGNTFKKGSDKSGKEENKDDINLVSDNEDFRQIIRQIRHLNDEIADEAVSTQIDRIEGYTKTIFEYVSAHTEAMPQIRKFLSYYLPTTLKLLESYSRIEKVGVVGENMQKSKENIEATLGMLETAFKLQIDDLFKSESIDISSDISVLETMMNSDGLSGKNDFDVSGRVDDEISEDFSNGLSGGVAQAQAPDRQ